MTRPTPPNKKLNFIVFKEREGQKTVSQAAQEVDLLLQCRRTLVGCTSPSRLATDCCGLSGRARKRTGLLLCAQAIALRNSCSFRVTPLL